MSAVKAAFTGWIPLVNFDEGASIPLCFILKLRHKLAPSHFRDGFAQAAVLHHVLDCQRLHTYDLVLAYEAGRELMQEVTASIPDASVNACNLDACLVSVLGTLFLLRVAALSLCQLLFILVEELRIADKFARRQGHKRPKAKVSTDRFVTCGQVLNVLFDQDADKVSVSTVFGDGDRRGDSAIGKRAGPANIEGFAHLGKGDVSIMPRESCANISSTLLIPFLVESRIGGSALKEVEERSIQMSQSLLQWDRSHIREPVVLILLFQVREHGRKVFVVQTNAVLVVRIGTLAQRPIVHKAATAKLTSQNVFLFLSGIYSVLESSFLLTHSLHCSMYGVESQEGTGSPSHAPDKERAFLPPPEDGGPPGAEL